MTQMRHSPVAAVAALTAAVLVVGWQVVLSPLMGEYAALAAQLSERARVRDAAAREAGRSVERNTRAAHIETQLATLAATTPQEAVARFVEVVTRAVHAARVDLRRLAPGVPREEPTRTRVPVELALEGSFAALTAVIDRLADESKVITIDRFTLAPAPSTGHYTGRLVATMTVVVAALPPPVSSDRSQPTGGPS